MSSARRKPDCVRDQQGAIMVMGVVMAVFLVAVLYQVVGIGETLLQRQQMQDAADAAAFSAAVVHARGMNTVVLINLVMAALLAVVVAFKLVETICAAAVVLITVASIFTGGAMANFIPPLVKAGHQAHKAADAARKVVFPQLQLLHTAARGVRAVVPVASEARVLDTVIGHYRPPAQAGVAFLPRFSLPVQDDRFEVLCGKAAANVGGLVAYPFEYLGGSVGDIIGDAIENATEGLGRSLSRWFCGEGKASFDNFTVKYDEPRPSLPSREQCKQYRKNPGGPYDADEHEQLCAQARTDEKASKPNSEGYCRFAGKLNEEELCQHYWERAERARSACKPGAAPKLKRYTWQEREIRLYYVKQQSGWVQVREVVAAKKRESKRKAPCKKDEWNQALGERDPELSTPVCSDYDPDKCEQPPVPETETRERLEAAIGETTAACYFTEVAQVLGCVRPEVTEEHATDPTEQDPLSEEQKRSRGRYLPQKMEDGVELGGDDFQLRALVVGQPLSGLSRASENVVRMATWGHNQEQIQQIYSEARHWGRLSVAQAEYYYSGEEEREQWMWNMNWKARLKRFRLPEGNSLREDGLDTEVEHWNGGRLPDDPEQSCRDATGAEDQGGSACDDLDGSLDFFDSMVVH